MSREGAKINFIQSVTQGAQFPLTVRTFLKSKQRVTTQTKQQSKQNNKNQLLYQFPKPGQHLNEFKWIRWVKQNAEIVKCYHLKKKKKSDLSHMWEQLLIYKGNCSCFITSALLNTAIQKGHLQNWSVAFRMILQKVVRDSFLTL